MKPYTKRVIFIACAIGVSVVILIVAGRFYVSQSSSPPAPAASGISSLVASPTSSVIGSSSGSESVDTKLSLGPQPSSSPRNISPAAPTASAGCTLSLVFASAGDNAQSSSADNYDLEAKNIGAATCQSASISLYYADNESFLSSSPAPTADGYYWRLGDLPPGQEEHIALSTTLSAPGASGISSDEACLSANNGNDACANAGQNASAIQVAQSMPATDPLVATTLAPSGRELGVWVWTVPSQMSVMDMQNVVNQAAANNFNVIYLTIDDYLNIAAMPDGPSKEQQLSSYEQSIASFLYFASEKNIAVDAESGATAWGQPGDTGEAGSILSFVADYNSSHAEKFRGVQYDIEPYLLPQYATNPSGTLTQYVQLIDAVAAEDKNDGLPLTIIVPDFYDANEQWTPEITVDGDTDYTYRQILRILNELPSSRIIIMAYRNFAAGANGSIDLSEPEIQEADATNVKVLVAQETGPVTPDYVTFSGSSRSALATQVAYINQAFGGDSSFGGIAIDYLDPFLSLPQ